MNHAQQTEAQIYGALTIQLYKVVEQYKSDPEVAKLWQALRDYDAARRAAMSLNNEGK